MKIPEWPPGTVAVLSTAGDAPHAIPVSTAVRTSAATVHLALGSRRASLERLRADGRCALTVIAEGMAVTLHGTATAVGEVEGAVAVRLDVERVQDHMQPTFAIDGGVAWRWTDDPAAAKDAAIRAGLASLHG